MKNEPNIEQIVLNPSRTPNNSGLMENLKFSQMTFPIFPHSANDFEQAWEILSHRRVFWPNAKTSPKASFLVIYFWIGLRSTKCIHFQNLFAIVPIFSKQEYMKRSLINEIEWQQVQGKNLLMSLAQKSLGQLTQNSELQNAERCCFLPHPSLF